MSQEGISQNTKLILDEILDKLISHEFWMKEKFFSLLGVFFSFFIFPVMYHYGSLVGGRIYFLNVIFGLFAATAFSLLFAKISSDAFADFYRKRSLPRAWLYIFNLNSAYKLISFIFWIIAAVAAIPLMYLNDKIGFAFFNFPIFISQILVYHWAQENIYLYVLKIMRKKSNFLWEGEYLEELFLKFIKFLESTNKKCLMNLDFKMLGYTGMLKKIIYDSRNIEESDFMSRSYKLLFLFSIIGGILGVMGASAYYFAGVPAPAYFALNYFHHNAPVFLGQLVGVLSFWCQGLLSGWAASQVFSRFFKISFLFIQNLKNNKININFSLLSINIIKLFASAAASFPRTEITLEHTGLPVFVYSAFISVFATSFVGFDSVKELAEIFRSKSFMQCFRDLTRKIIRYMPLMNSSHLTYMVQLIKNPTEYEKL